MTTGVRDSGAVAAEFAELRAAISVATAAVTLAQDATLPIRTKPRPGIRLGTSRQDAAGRITSSEDDDADGIVHRTTHTW